jgi:apolipoprotein D and lipocalin family protein
MKLLTVFLLFLYSCGAKNDVNSQPIDNFEVDKYLGTWYEIARTDNRFERNCTNVAANYSLREDGGISVINKCFVNAKEKVVTGRAYFKEKQNIGALKVTFFWPFYGKYNIVYLDENYQYAIVDGGKKEYLWILSRTKTLDNQTIQMLHEKIKASGFDVETLIYTTHN